MNASRTLILGAGFGGLTAAVELAARLPAGHSVTLVDRKESFLMGLAKLWMLDGRRAPGEGERPIAAVARHGVHHVQGEVGEIDLAGRRVLVDGRELEWDRLVIALGADLAPGAIPGMEESGRNLYSPQGVTALHRDLASLRGGNVLVLVAATPFKCPPAPYEAAVLTKRFLDSRGIDANVAVATPEPHPLPVTGPECGGTIRAWVEERGVEVLNQHRVKEVDPRERVVRFEGGGERRFDLLAYVPVHRAPQVLAKAGLLGDAGWIPVDSGTLATRHPDVWAVGDCNVVKLPVGKPLVKAGVMAEGEARVVAENVAALAAGGEGKARFDGRGGCFLELGDGLAVEVQGDFYATPAPVVTVQAPSKRALEAKREFETARLRRWFADA